MTRSSAVVLVAVLALLFIGGRDRDPDPAVVEFDTVPAPAVPEPVPLEPAVPLAVSETTPPPGWDPPDTAEEQLANGLHELGQIGLYQLGLAVVGLLLLLGLMYYVERRRHG